MSRYIRQQAKIVIWVSHLLPSVSVCLHASLTIVESEYITDSITGIFSFGSENSILGPVMFVNVTGDYPHIEHKKITLGRA